MAKDSKSSGGIGHQIEELHTLNNTASITGGDAFQRRVLNNYSKHAHAEQDRQREVIANLPDISLPRILSI